MLLNMLCFNLINTLILKINYLVVVNKLLDLHFIHKNISSQKLK